MTDEQPQHSIASEAATVPKPDRAQRKPRKGPKSAPKPGANQKKKPAPRSRAKAARPGSKTAKVIAMLKRSSGATLAQLMKATGWQAHSVRGFLAGTVTKKLEMKLQSNKPENGDRVYSVRG